MTSHDNPPIDGTHFMVAAVLVALVAAALLVIDHQSRPARFLLLAACVLALVAVVRAARQAIREIKEDQG